MHLTLLATASNCDRYVKVILLLRNVQTLNQIQRQKWTIARHHNQPRCDAMRETYLQACERSGKAGQFIAAKAASSKDFISTVYARSPKR